MRYVLFLLLVAVSGCATAHKFNRLSLGMTKAEVIDAIGDPYTTRASGGREIMAYRLYQDGHNAFLGLSDEHWVVLDGGRVTTYGKAGDFGTVRDPAAELTIKHQ